ncbi:MAG: cell division protein ZapA [Bacteroidota bacterium]|nr:cell division protein ZapA [Candidatus Kapabacteria bacterium]MDW8219568.1 cell division protein ZapA [Bacteroidota bacterium]
MNKTVRVHIAGSEYNLRSDDETKVREVAAAVDAQFRQLQAISKEQSTATLSILTALNIAEKEYEMRRQQRADMAYLASEVEKMVAFLRQSYPRQHSEHPAAHAGERTNRSPVTTEHSPSTSIL